MGEYKMVPHDAAIRVPMIFAGPGFDHATRMDQIVSLLDLTPTLIDGAGLRVPENMQGKSLKSLPTDVEARRNWDSTAYIQVSESMVGRAIRTPEWTFSVYDPTMGGDSAPHSNHYIDYAMYHNGADPYQKVNLIGRPWVPYIRVDGKFTTEGRVDYKEISSELRAELKRRIVGNGEPEPVLQAQNYFV